MSAVDIDWDVNPGDYYSAGSHRDGLLERVAALLPAANATVLDFGAGDGRLVRYLDDSVRMIAYDRSRAMRELGRRTIRATGNDHRASVADSMNEIPHGQMDAAVLNLVWTCFETAACAIDCLRAVRQTLKPGGYVVATQSHPCFRWWHYMEQASNLPVEAYGTDGKRFVVTIGFGDRVVRIPSVHYPLSSLLAQAAKAGFVVSALHEWPELVQGRVPADAPPLWLCLVMTHSA